MNFPDPGGGFYPLLLIAIAVVLHGTAHRSSNELARALDLIGWVLAIIALVVLVLRFAP